MPAQKFSAKEAAAELGTDARTLRKFLRSKQSPLEPVGQGNRYEFDSKEMKALKKAFVAWSAGSKAKTEKPAKKKTKSIDDMTTEERDAYAKYLGEVEEGRPHAQDDDESPEDEIAFLEGPSDEDLEEIDDVEIELIDLDD